MRAGTRVAALVVPLLVACGPLPQELDWAPDHFERVFLDPLEPPGRVHVRLSEQASYELRHAPREWVPGSVRIDGENFDVEVRLKGWGSFQPLDARPSLKIRFDPDWYGHDVLIFNNYTSDPSKTHERLATHAFHLMGMPAARAGWARVRINGEDRGVYGAVEDVDHHLLERWFARGDGSLYELFDGDFEDELLEGIEHEEGPDIRPLLRHIAIDLATGDLTGFELAAEHFDVDAFLTFWATTAVVAQTDAFPYSSPGDDAYLYFEPDQEQFHFLPHGLDEAFFPRGRVVNQSNGLLARRCLALPSCLDAFRAKVEEVFDTLEHSDFEAHTGLLIDRARELRFEDEVVEPTTTTQAPMPGFNQHWGILRSWLPTRRVQLEEELAPRP